MSQVCLLVTSFLTEQVEVVNCTVYVISRYIEGKKILNSPEPCLKLIRHDEVSECKSICCFYHNSERRIFQDFGRSGCGLF